mmetsp:Transcript_71501/g.225809  ORF Transcript_71501/g.225809 Transcript_71501/m.225809 type:complete len:200 (-) Transcript_71501:478-1077(-)
MEEETARLRPRKAGRLQGRRRCGNWKRISGSWTQRRRQRQRRRRRRVARHGGSPIGGRGQPGGRCWTAAWWSWARRCGHGGGRSQSSARVAAAPRLRAASLGTLCHLGSDRARGGTAGWGTTPRVRSASGGSSSRSLSSSAARRGGLARRGWSTLGRGPATPPYPSHGSSQATASSSWTPTWSRCGGGAAGWRRPASAM